jgi:hypothetical protein
MRGFLGSAPNDPLPNLSLIVCCNPLDLGALEYKDQQLLDVGPRWPDLG